MILATLCEVASFLLPWVVAGLLYLACEAFAEGE
jgi:hypothetical protein